MPSNIEIKARLADRNDVEKRARALSDSGPFLIKQEDIFFHSARGRLKLRIFNPRKAELIYYERPDRAGPKKSSYVCIKTNQPAEIKKSLSKAIGILGVVRKRRTLYIVRNTRIHLDDVEGLGQFLELEVVLSDEQAPRQGQKIAEQLMKRLGIKRTDLISCAYLDLLKGGKA